MLQQWAMQDAKARLSELVKKAQKEGPQSITVRGEPIVIVISEEDYQALTAPKISLVEFFQKSPLVGVHLDLSRDESPMRDIDL